MLRILLGTVLLLSPYLQAQELSSEAAQEKYGAPAQSSAARQANDADKCTVTGKVIDAETGNPLKKAVVTLSPAEKSDVKNMSVGTDAEGAFLIRNIPPGRFRLSAAHRGYVTQQYGQTGPMRPGTLLTLIPGQNLKDISFRLQAGGVITGRVADEDGEPMIGVQVNGMKYTYREGKRTLMPMGVGNTNDLGEYRIYGLPPGQYYVRAIFNGMMAAGMFTMGDAEQAGDNAYPPTFYPGVQEISQASTMNLRPGEELRADFNLSPAHAFSIRGKVVNISESGRRAWLMLMPRSSDIVQFGLGPGGSAAVGSDGTFEFKHVLPGSYTIFGQMIGEEKVRLMARQNIEVGDRDLNNVVVAFSPGIDIQGRITTTGNFPQKLRSLNISLEDNNGNIMNMVGAPAKDDGSFTLSNAADDLYKIRVNGLPPNAYIKSIQYGSEDVFENGLRPAGARSPLEITISGDGGKVSGTVTKDQNAQPGVTVIAIPDRPLKWILESSRFANTDQTGRFTLQGLRPGRYRVYAFEEIEPGAYEDPEFMKKYQNDGKAVDISENAQQSLDLTVILKDQEP